MPENTRLECDFGGMNMQQYLITGAAGHIGSMLAKKLLSNGAAVDVIVRDPSRLDMEILSSTEPIQADITNREAIFRITKKYDHIIHCAAPTDSAYMVSHPVEVIDAIVNGTEHVLNLAERCDAKSFVYISSMEVYGQISCPKGKRAAEHEMGHIDASNIRSCYPIAKLMAENLCHSYYKEYGVPVKIARLAQTFGTGVKAKDNRVYMQFARAVVEHRDIILRTQGRSIGNCCASEDTVNAILTILEKGQNGETYNVVNEANTMSIREMAQLVAEHVAGGSIAVKIEETSSVNKYAPDTGLRMSSAKLEKLGWKATKGIVEMYMDVIKELKKAID